MKKLFLLSMLLIATISANAQIYVGGSLGFWYDSHNDPETTTFTVAPEIGYNINQKWAVGGVIDYTYGKVDYVSANSFAIAPYARFSYYRNGIVRLFIDGGFGVSTTSYSGADSVTGIEIGFKPGIAFEVNKHFSLVAKCGFLGWREDYSLGTDGQGLLLSSEDLSLGFHYEF
jgi:hypothetical protein